MHDFQGELLTLDLPHQLAALLAVHVMPVMILLWAVVRAFAFRPLLRIHVSLSTVNSTRLGPGGENCTLSPSGSGLSPFQENAAAIFPIANAGAKLLCRAVTLQSRLTALAAEPCCAQILIRGESLITCPPLEDSF